MFKRSQRLYPQVLPKYTKQFPDQIRSPLKRKKSNKRVNIRQQLNIIHQIPARTRQTQQQPQQQSKPRRKKMVVVQQQQQQQQSHKKKSDCLSFFDFNQECYGLKNISKRNILKMLVKCYPDSNSEQSKEIARVLKKCIK